MTCNLCTGDKPFSVPFGDGKGEALMAAHMQEEHGERGPMNRLRAWRSRAVSPAGINELAWDSHDRYYDGR